MLVDTTVDHVEVGKDGVKVELRVLLGVASVCVCSPSSVHVVELEDAGATMADDDSVEEELLDEVVTTLV